MATPSDTHKPRAVRFQAALPARLEFEGTVYPCQADNLSRNGALLLGQLPAILNKEGLVTVESAGGDLSITFNVRVLRQVIDEESGEPLLGVEFVSIKSGEPEVLEALVHRVMEGGAPSWTLEDLPINAKPEAVRAALDRIPLPHRMQLAARGNPRERALLIKDSNLQVLDALARNPRILMREVLVMLRMRNLLAGSLEVLSRDQRWMSNEQACVMLTTHRNTPQSVAQRLVQSMSKSTMQKVLRAPALHPALQAAILKRMGPGKR